MDKKKIKARVLAEDNPPPVPKRKTIAKAIKADRKRKREDVNQAAARIVRQATEH